MRQSIRQLKNNNNNKPHIINTHNSNNSKRDNSTNNSHNEVPRRDLPATSTNNGDTKNVGRANFSSSLADQLKIRLEERRKHSDETETQDLAADVQKAVNIANESSKFV